MLTLKWGSDLIIIIILFVMLYFTPLAMIGESFGVKFSDSDTVKSYIKELINRFHETSTDTKFSPIIHPPLIRKASLKAAFFYA